MSVQNQVMRAKRIIARGDFKWGLEILEKQLQQEPNDVGLKLLIARTKVDFENAPYEERLKNMKEAKELCTQTLTEKNKYFSRLELGRIEAMLGNLEEARWHFELLLGKHIEGYALFELGKLELFLDNRQEATSYFEQLLQKGNKAFALTQLLYLACKEEDYEKAYFYYQEYLALNDTKNAPDVRTRFYLLHQLNRLEKMEQDNPKYYFEKQLMNYKEQEAIHHVKQHAYKKQYLEKHCCFLKGLDTRIMFQQVQDQIQQVEPNSFTIVDKYILKQKDMISRVDDNETNLIEVITILNQKRILTMYPLYNSLYEMQQNAKKKIKGN